MGPPARCVFPERGRGTLVRRCWNRCQQTARNRLILKHATTSGATKGSGAVQTNATGSAKVKLSTLLPARVPKAMKPGLYRVTFVARNAKGLSPERVIPVRVLEQQR
jgi:hypothetical protein